MKAVIEKLHRTLQHTQLLPPQQLIAYQRTLLEPLLRHARANVPFYRDSGRLEPLFRHDNTVDWDRWSELPPLTRNEVQSSFEDLKSDPMPTNHGKQISLATSGSTGEPVTIVSTELARLSTWAAVRLREFEWHRIDTSQRLGYFLSPSVHSTTANQAEAIIQGRYEHWYRTLAQFIPAGERIDISDMHPMSELLEQMVKLQPRYIHIQPTTLELIVAHDTRGRLDQMKIDAIFAYGETITPAFKAHIESRLNTRVLAVYASTECGVMAGSCPYCGRMHVHAEFAHVEAVSDSNEPVAPGEIGRLVITPFYNYAMPLIRYDHQDYVRMGTQDQCTITLPVFDELIGKKRPPFIFPGGHTIRPTLPAQWVIECLGARTYQVAQVEQDRCEFRIVPGTIAPSAMKFDEMTRRLRTFWWDGLKVDYKIVDDLPRRSPRSKIQTLVQEMPDVAPVLPATAP